MNKDFIVTGLSLNFKDDKVYEIENRVKWANIMLIIIYVFCFYYSLISLEALSLYLLFLQIMFFFNGFSLFFRPDDEIFYLDYELNILRNKSFINIYLKDNKVVYLLYDGEEFESTLFDNIVFSSYFVINNLNLTNRTIEIIGNPMY